MTIDPDAEVLTAFGVQLVAPLGGRKNQHWLVQSAHEQFVVRRWAKACDTTHDDIDYELRLLTQIAALGWPVPAAVDGPVVVNGDTWSLFPFLPGDPPSAENSVAEQRSRGQLLARFHNDLAQLRTVEQRGAWRRCEETLGDPLLDEILSNHESRLPEEVGILRWHLNRARERIVGLALPERPGIIIHGDFAPWNLRFQEGALSGILDFELAHVDHRVADFSLSWRGKYDAVIHGYAEVSPLEPEEWALITPLWWASLIEIACRDLANGTPDDGWVLRKLLVRSPLMGPDSAALP